MANLRHFVLDATAKPLPTDMRQATPDDVVRNRYLASSAEEQAELRQILVRLLVEAAHQNLWRDPWRLRTRYLAQIVDELSLTRAKPPLLYLAQQELPEDLMEWVLYGLAGTQRGPSLWSFWLSRWRQSSPRLRPVISAGLRLCAPAKDLALLPALVVDIQDQDWLGTLLWSHATDPATQAGFPATMATLSLELRAVCRQALQKVGASPDELQQWLPETP